MADNIKIVGEILNTQEISRYTSEDINLLDSFTLKENFGQQNDYIEYYAYDAAGNLLSFNYNYLDYKLPSTSYINPTNGSLPIIEIDPVKDLQNLGYSTGEFVVQYNFFNNKISNANQPELFLKEISSDRTELRVGSTTLTNQQIEESALSIINEYTSSLYFVEYLINFSNNVQAIAVNTALNKIESGYEILFKLYQPLPDNIEKKSTLWVVKEKINPYIFDINLDKLVLPPTGSYLRGPNFDIELSNTNNIDTSYQTYSSLINNFQNVSSSYHQLLNLITSQSIDINTDYTNFSNFIFFSSAKQRLTNFYNKVKDIEDYNTLISTYTPQTSSYPSLVSDINTATSSINNIIANFDGFEYYLYFESGSTLTSSLEYGINPYPKSNSSKPFILFSTSSTTTNNWFNASIINAESYDDYNQNNLVYTVPTFIKEDENNNPYLVFLNMVGHYFDNIWIYLDAITDINLANNNLEKGVSKDLVYTVLQSLGTKLYNKYGDAENDFYLVGQNSGSIEFDNNFTPTGSYLNNIPRKDLVAEVYKRIYHNLPLLLKTKGTTYGLQTLISTFGITSSILNVREYGGNLKSDTLNEYNNQKVRVVTNNIYTGSILSPNISLQVYPSQSTEFRTEDYHYVDISFSPENQINSYASSAISAVNPTWNIDDYIGDPNYLYSSSYTSLDNQRNSYYNFNPSYLDYAGFIRLIQFFDNSLFKMLKDFVPARANLSTGVTINSPILERNKFIYSNPSSTSQISIYTGSIDGPTINTEYTNLYTYLTGSKLSYYDGNITGSVIEYGTDWIEKNFNPYLIPTFSLTPPALNNFNHSDFNVLFNNVSSSLKSIKRKLLEPIYTGSGLNPIIIGYSSSYFAELQDSYETLITYNKARYDGTKISSLFYNEYTSASLTYVGDNSYGKTATIDKNVRQIGLFTEIISSSFLPKRNRVSLKYLVDEFGGLTELNQRNKHWEEVQRTFIAGDIFNISLFDNQKFGNQKTTDGNKLIFDSGYSYYPILYFASCSNDPTIYFENLGGPSAYRATAKNVSSSYFISGSPSLGFPITAGAVKNIFNYETEDISNVFSPGTLLSFPSYSVEEAGGYKIQTSFDVTVTLPDNQAATWSLQIYKSSSILAETLLLESENIYTDISPTTSYRILFATGSTAGAACFRGPSNSGVGWSSVQYPGETDIIYTNSGLTTAVNITGYFALYLPNTPDPTYYGPTRTITNGVLGSDVGVDQC